MSKHLLSYFICFKIFFLLIVFSLLSEYTYAQTSLLTTAEKLFAKGEYYPAAILYEKCLSKEKVDSVHSSFKPYFIHKKETVLKASDKIAVSHATWNLAECYRLINDYKSAMKWYKICFDNYHSIFPLSLYWYGVCLRANNDYSMAEASLQNFISTYKGNDIYKDEAQKELNNLEFIRRQLESNHRNLYEIKKMQPPLNHEGGCFAATVKDDGTIILTSTQTDSSAIKQNKNPYRNRLFKTSFLNGRLGEMNPLVIEGTDALMDQGAASYAASGNKIYFTQWQKEDEKTVAEIYYSIKSGDQWGKPIKAARINTDGYSSIQPCITSDGKYIFFSSNRPGGYGKYDLWYAMMKDDDIISDPINLGKIINSPGDEKTPCYSGLTKTLVFSTNGRTGFGGFDFFRTKGEINSWEEPVNMGSPFNSSRDDVYFFSKETNKSYDVYFSSDRESSCCLELYNVKKIKQDKILTGLLIDCKTGLPLADGKIYVTELQHGRIVDSLTTNISGRYNFDFNDNDSFDLMISKTGYNSKTTKINSESSLPGYLSENDTLQTSAICIEKIPNENIVVDGKETTEEKEVIVYFDFDKSDIDPESRKKLDLVFTKLNDNPTWVVEIGGYTDEKGSDKYNLDLGYKRAKATAAYLMNKGIAGNRVRLKSYGKCCPVNKTDPSMKVVDTDLLNRRVQFIFFTGSD